MTGFDIYYSRPKKPETALICMMGSNPGICRVCGIELHDTGATECSDQCAVQAKREGDREC